MRDGERYSKRCRRWDTPGQAHALTFSCYEQQPLLGEDRFCRYPVEAIDNARSVHAFDLWAYVFMPEHVHLVLYLRCEGYSIARILQSIKQPVSRKALAFLREHCPGDLARLATGQQNQAYQFWQKGGGYDRNVTRVETLIETVRYVHNNPVRRGLVQTADQWYHSSAAQWDGIRPGPLTLDRDNFPTCRTHRQAALDAATRGRLVQTGDQWYYSSAAQWEGIGPGPLTLDRDNFPTC